MPIYEQTPIRLQATLIGSPPVVPIDNNTGATPKFWRGSSVGFAIAIFDSMGNPVDLTNIVSGQLQLFLFKSQSALIPLVSKSLAGSDLYPLITKAGWENGTQQNATFLLEPGDTDQGLGGAASAPFWIVLNGITQDGSVLVYAAGPCTIYNASSALPASALPTPSFDEQNNASGNTTITPTSNLHMQLLTLSGSARTSNAIVTFAGLSPGALVTVLVDAAGAPPGIDLEFFIGSLAGANPFAFSTDGGTTRALFRFYFDGATLQPLEQVNPAY